MHDDSTMLACMEKAAQLRPENVTYLERLGQVFIKTHDYNKATEVYEQLAATSPARTDVLGILLQLYQHADNYDKVIATLDRIETLEGSSEDLTLSKMQVYAIQGDKKKEIKELRNLARQHPNDYKYRVMIGNWLLQNGKEKEALSEYNSVLKKEPDNIMAQMSLLDYYKAQHQDSLARAQAEQLLLSPNTEQDSKVLLVSFARSGNSPESVGAVRAVEQTAGKVAHIFITCNPEGQLAKTVGDNILTLLRPPETNESALAMTSSYSATASMAAPCCSIVSICAIMAQTRSIVE